MLKENFLNKMMRIKGIGLGFGVLTLILSLVFSINVIGFWEASSLFFSYSPEAYFFNFSINPRASIGSYEYPALDVSRVFIQLFGFRLESFRLSSMIFSALGVLFFYSFVQKVFNIKTAILSTILLLSNKIFVVFSFQFLIISYSFFIIFFLFYIFEYCNTKPSKGAIGFLALSIVLATSGYFSTRYMGVIFCLGFLFSLRVSNEGIRFTRTFLFYLALIFLAFGPVNFLRIFSGDFLVPSEGGSNANEFSLDFYSLKQNLSVNIPLMLDSFTGFSDFYSSNAYRTLLAEPFKVGELYHLLIALAGVIIFVKKKLYFYIFCCVVLFCAPVISQVWPNLLTSLSPYRQAFGSIAVAIMSSGGIFFVENHLSRRGDFFVVIVIVVSVFSLVELYGQKQEFFDEVSTNVCINNDGRSVAKGVCSNSSTDCDMVIGCFELEKGVVGGGVGVVKPRDLGHRYMSEFVRPYHRLIERIINDGLCKKDNTPRILHVNVKDVKRATSHLWGYPYDNFLLATLLSSEGCKAGFPMAYSRELTFTDRIFAWTLNRIFTGQPGTDPFSRQYNYPLRLEGGEYLIPVEDFYDKLYAIPQIKLVKSKLDSFFSNPIRRSQQVFFDQRGVVEKADILIVSNRLEIEFVKSKFPKSEVHEVWLDAGQ